MAESDELESQGSEIRSLAELFEGDSKRFEWMAKQYYDLFAYHAAQRLTAFNFFLVSLSFFSTAYATLISRSGEGTVSYFPVAGVLASAAYLLVVAFGRLDKRNEQIIGINEKPLIRIQRAIRLGLAPVDEEGDDVWETFVQTDKSYRFRTFGELLPVIYCLAATACAAGAMFGFSGPGDRLHILYFPLWLVMTGAAIILICKPLWSARDGAAALNEAKKVVRVRAADKAPAPLVCANQPGLAGMTSERAKEAEGEDEASNAQSSSGVHGASEAKAAALETLPRSPSGRKRETSAKTGATKKKTPRSPPKSVT